MSNAEEPDLHIELENMSLDELKSLRKQVDNAIADFEERKRQEARSEVERVASEYGFSVDDIIGAPKTSKASKTSKRSKSPPKYRNPENPSQTWSGLGRRPKWFTRALEQGKSEEDMRI